MTSKHPAARMLVLAASGAILTACSTSGTADSKGPTTIEPGSGGADIDAGDPDARSPDATAISTTATPEAGAPRAPDATPTVGPDGSAPPVSSPAACGLAVCAPGEPCPDLAVDPNDLVGSIQIGEEQFDDTSCAIAEGCILQTGLRRLLRFDTATMNIGNADLHVGDPTQNACFTFSQCHQHYHFRGVGEYTLYAADGKTVVAVGHKQGFCLDDTYPIPSLNPPPAQPATPFDCTNQGLHVGYEDVYPNNIDCQWIDITGVPPGNYVLSVTINAQHYLPESNYDNNTATAPVTIPNSP